MERQYTIILAIGLVICGIFFFIDMYLGGIAAIILIMLGMSFFIMQDVRVRPEIGVVLRDDAKGIIVINRGTDVAKKYMSPSSRITSNLISLTLRLMAGMNTHFRA
jgi:hypothetical protein